MASPEQPGSKPSDSKPPAPKRPDRWARHRARAALVQALFQWQFSQPATHELEQQFATAGKLAKVDREFFRAALKLIMHNTAELDTLLTPLLDRPFADLGRVERGILWLGAYELRDCLEVPYRVVISEGVTLAKSYGAEDSHKFVNAVLDRLARDLRPDECAAQAS